MLLSMKTSITKIRFVWLSQILVGLVCLNSVGEELQFEVSKQTIAKLLYSGSMAVCEDVTTKLMMATPQDDELRFYLGIIQYNLANERFVQSMFIHGAKSRYDIGQFSSSSIASNPNSSSTSYFDCRKIFQAYLNDLNVAEKTLSLVQNKDVELRLDINKVRYDANGDGFVDEKDHTDNQTPQGSVEEDVDAKLYYVDVLNFRYDCKIKMAHINGALKYDLQRYFDLQADHYFTKPLTKIDRMIDPANRQSKTEVQKLRRMRPMNDNLQVVERERAEASLTLTLEALELQRQIYQFRIIDSDSFRRMTYSDKQLKELKYLLLTKDKAAFQLKQANDIESVLLGKKLLPHPKLKKDSGINVRRAFLENTELDITLNGTGDYWGEFVEQGECIDAGSLKDLPPRIHLQLYGYGCPPIYD